MWGVSITELIDHSEILGIQFYLIYLILILSILYFIYKFISQKQLYVIDLSKEANQD